MAINFFRTNPWLDAANTVSGVTNNLSGAFAMLPRQRLLVAQALADAAMRQQQLGLEERRTASQEGVDKAHIGAYGAQQKYDESRAAGQTGENTRRSALGEAYRGRYFPGAEGYVDYTNPEQAVAAAQRVFFQPSVEELNPISRIAMALNAPELGRPVNLGQNEVAVSPLTGQSLGAGPLVNPAGGQMMLSTNVSPFIGGSPQTFTNTQPHAANMRPYDQAMQLQLQNRVGQAVATGMLPLQDASKMVNVLNQLFNSQQAVQPNTVVQPPPAAISLLIANPTPEVIQQFDAKYGPGAANRYLP